MPIVDVTFELDAFSKNRLVRDIYAAAQQLYVLLVMVPGDTPDDPDKGINFTQYNFGWAEENAIELQNKIEEQVNMYCDFSIKEMQIDLIDDKLVCAIAVNNMEEVIVFSSDGDSVITQLVSL